MSEPTVCAICLTADRPEMTRKAVECFRAQDYPAKRLYIYDTGSIPAVDAFPDQYPDFGIVYHRALGMDRSIGQLRNSANSWACSGEGMARPEILIHLDSDDWSSPNRIAEQVALLQSTGADVAGYREMLFWREGGWPLNQDQIIFDQNQEPQGEAWLFSSPNPSYALGTSLAYWRKTWERRPFEATSCGEDARFIAGLKCVAVSSLAESGLYIPADPRMVARIHSGNASIIGGQIPAWKGKSIYDPMILRAIEKQGGEWKRVPAWDEYARKTMEIR